jgi:hypothetical protein
MTDAHDVDNVARFLFVGFGLTISANCPVPGLQSAVEAVEPDVRIWLGQTPPGFGASRTTARTHSIEASSEWVTVWKHEEYFQLRYNDGTEFFIARSGDTVWAVWPDDLTLEDTATYLLGPIINIVLRLRGTLTLHASAVRIGTEAVAFVGPQGAGKSTLAAFFATAGHVVLTDDAAAIEDNGRSFKIIPAYPRVRLWPTSANLLFGSHDALPRLTPGWDKLYLELGVDKQTYQFDAAPLAAVYFLDPRSDEGGTPRIEPITHRDAMIRLIGNIGGNALLGEVDPAKSFDQLQRIARFVPLRTIVPTSGMESLLALRTAVEEDLRTIRTMAA